MDEKIKQTIEEMAKLIIDNAWESVKKVEAIVCAEALYKAGYRKESDTAKEVLNKIRSLFPTAERCDFGDLYLIDKIKKIAEEYGVELEE